MYGIFTNIFPKNGAYGIQVPRASYHWFSHFRFLSSSADFEASHTARMTGHCCLSMYYRLYYRYYIYKALPGYLFFLPRLFVLSRVLFSKGYSDLLSFTSTHTLFFMDAVQGIHNHHLFRVRVFCANFSWKHSCIECMVFGECIDASYHEWKQKCDRQKSRAVGGSKCHGPQQAQAHNRFDLRCSVLSFYSQHRSIEYVMSR